MTSYVKERFVDPWFKEVCVCNCSTHINKEILCQVMDGYHISEESVDRGFTAYVSVFFMEPL
jgi:hypothetical protein